LLRCLSFRKGVGRCFPEVAGTASREGRTLSTRVVVVTPIWIALSRFHRSALTMSPMVVELQTRRLGMGLVIRVSAPESQAIKSTFSTSAQTSTSDVRSFRRTELMFREFRSAYRAIGYSHIQRLTSTPSECPEMSQNMTHQQLGSELR
jgi:hypothetical protein